jgi:hypothetical protein
MNPYKQWSYGLDNLSPEDWEHTVKKRALESMANKRIIRAGDLIQYQKAGLTDLSGLGASALIGLVTDAKFENGNQFIKILWSQIIPEGSNVPDSKDWWFSTSSGKWKILNR